MWPFFVFPELSIPVKVAIMPSFFFTTKRLSMQGSVIHLFINNKSMFIIEMDFTVVFKFLCNNRCCRESSWMKLRERSQFCNPDAIYVFLSLWTLGSFAPVLSRGRSSYCEKSFELLYEQNFPFWSGCHEKIEKINNVSWLSVDLCLKQDLNPGIKTSIIKFSL